MSCERGALLAELLKTPLVHPHFFRNPLHLGFDGADGGKRAGEPFRERGVPPLEFGDLSRKVLDALFAERPDRIRSDGGARRHGPRILLGKNDLITVFRRTRECLEPHEDAGADKMPRDGTRAALPYPGKTECAAKNIGDLSLRNFTPAVALASPQRFDELRAIRFLTRMNFGRSCVCAPPASLFPSRHDTLLSFLRREYFQTITTFDAERRVQKRSRSAILGSMRQHTFIFIGASGSGKGTQVKLLMEEIRKRDSGTPIFYLQTGQLFREFVKGESYAARMARDEVERGELLPTFVAMWMWSDVFIKQLTGGEHLIIDGSPRTTDEVHHLDIALKFFRRARPSVIYLNVSPEWSRKRMLERAEEEGRKDDTAEGIERRLRWFEQNVIPAVNLYRRDRDYDFYEIDGERTIPEVHNEIMDICGARGDDWCA